MKDDEGNPTKLLSAAHAAYLQEIFTANKIRVVIVDPIMSTIPGTTNINQNNETRQHVEPWGQLADAIDGIVLGVCHFTKFPTGDLVAAINGSSAFGEVARAIFGFVKDKKSGDRVMSQVKNSTGMEDLSLKYEINSADVPTDLGGIASVAAFTITGRSQLSAADVLEAGANGEVDIGGPGFAMQWLSEYLTQQGGAPAKEVIAKAKVDQDISRATLYRAMKQLGVVSYREGFPCTAYWRLSTPEDGTQR
jgi:AAA domain